MGRICLSVVFLIILVFSHSTLEGCACSLNDKLDGSSLGDEFVDPWLYMITNRSDPIHQSNNKDVLHLDDNGALAVFAAAHIMNSISYYGIQVTSDVYAFSVDKDEKTGIFIQINNSGDNSLSNLNGISVGWHRDGYQKTGCYNLKCSGYIPEANIPTPPGLTINTVSDPNGVKRAIIFKVFKYGAGDWLVRTGFDSETYLVGRFPKSIFTSLGDKADENRLYGAVQTHTIYMTPMGSGFHSSSNKAASFSNIQLIGENGRTYLVKNVPDFTTDGAIYSVSSITPEGRFTYGGPLE